MQKCLKHEEAKQCTIEPAMVRDFMRKLRRGTYDTLEYQKMLVHIFVDKIFLYDDHFTLLLNNNKKRANTSKAEVETIEEYFAGVSSDTEECCVPIKPLKFQRFKGFSFNKKQGWKIGFNGFLTGRKKAADVQIIKIALTGDFSYYRLCKECWGGRYSKYFRDSLFLKNQAL